MASHFLAQAGEVGVVGDEILVVVAVGLADLAGLAAPPRTRREPGGDPDGGDDEDLVAYNAYLARLSEEVRGHGRWHGLR